MFLPALLLLTAQAPQPKPAAAVVAMEARSIILPALPADGAQGRARFRETHGRIQDTQKDLDGALLALYARPEAARSLRGLAVPEEALAEGRELLEILKDTEHARLEKDFADTWRGWQAALVEGALAPAGKAPAAPASPRFEAARETARKVVRETARTLGTPADRLDASYNVENANLYTSLGQLQSEEQRVTDRGVEASVTVARRTLTVANKLIPELAAAWQPMVAHLNAQAVRLIDLEQRARTSPGGPLGDLRVQARIAYLERFRTALWYCDLVWAQVASAELPHAPGRLR
jgi:hypothetical protein